MEANIAVTLAVNLNGLVLCTGDTILHVPLTLTLMPHRTQRRQVRDVSSRGVLCPPLGVLVGTGVYGRVGEHTYGCVGGLIGF